MILATPEYATWFDDFKDFVPSLIQHALHLTDNTESFELDVLVAIVDGLPPPVDWISTANQRPTSNGLAFLQGDTSRILPGLWTTSDNTSDGYSEKLSSLTFSWRKRRQVYLGFDNVASAVRAKKACDNMDRFKGTKIGFHGLWFDRRHSAKWSAGEQVPNHISEHSPGKRTIALSGWTRPLNTLDIAFVVRGAPLQDIRFTDDSTREVALVTFQTSAEAAAFFAYSQKHPREVTHGGTKLTVSWGPMSEDVLPESKEAIPKRATRLLRFESRTPWNRKTLVKLLSCHGTITPDKFAEDLSSAAGIDGLTVTMPLANTLFTNGRYSTLLVSKWKVDGTTIHNLKCMEKKNQLVEVESPKPRSLPIATESARAIPLTLPRRIVSGLGNIVRQLASDTEGAQPASRELEANVHSYLAAAAKQRVSIVDEKIRVWALIVPEHLAKEFLESSPTELHFHENIFGRLLRYPVERGTHPVKRVQSSVPMLPGESLGYWISKGAMLCRVRKYCSLLYIYTLLL